MLRKIKTRTKLRRNSATHNLLKSIAIASGVLVISAINPGAGAQIVRAAIAGYFRRKAFDRNRFLRDLKNLQTRNLVDCCELSNGDIRITLTKTGKEKTLVYGLDAMTLKNHDHWDGKWRLVMFDIPNECKTARDMFRKKLKDLKFYQLQKSVFITPYSCESEIDFLASLYEVGKHVLLLSVDGFEGEDKLKNYFDL